jgi:hypothetical protein
MTSYHDLGLLSQQRVQTLLAEAAAQRLALRLNPPNTRISFRTHIARAICGLITRLEPTPIQAELEYMRLLPLKARISATREPDSGDQADSRA